jgi:XTP/dITP diphosphohydrolase
MQPVSVVLATANPHKVEELSAIFANTQTPVRLLTLQQGCELARVPLPSEPAETRRTFEANCAIKALAYSQALGLPCIADDSGLEVDALNGAPGVDSSHFAFLQGAQSAEASASRAARDEANLRLVLQRLQHVPLAQRSARFVCVMTLAHQGSVLATTRGTMEGVIGEPPRVPRGEHGFGYDPIFLVGPECTHTGAELSPQEKNARSHRSRAGHALARELLRLLPALNNAR